MSDPSLARSRARRRDRRRRHRHLGRLPPRAHGLEGRRAAGARPAHLRHHLARRRPDGHVRLDLRDLDRDAQVHARPLPPARGRDRPGHRLQARRLHRGRRRRRPARGVPPRRRLQPLLRRRRARDLAVRGEAPVPARARRRHPGRLLRQGRRPREPGRRHHGAGQGRPPGRAPASSKACPSPASCRSDGRVTGVRTAHGDIEAEYVVNCAGMWARQLGEEVGVTIPNQAAEHYYLITEKIPDLPPGCRCSRTPPPTATSARRPAACWSACSSRCARRGTSRASRTTSPSARSSPTGTAWGPTWRRPWRACRSR